MLLDMRMMVTIVVDVIVLSCGFVAGLSMAFVLAVGCGDMWM